MTMTQNSQTQIDTHEHAAANDISNNNSADISADINSETDNNINLASTLEIYFRPDEQTIVCGALDQEKVQALADAGVELVINLQADAELGFDEASAVKQAGMTYEHLPISGVDDLKQLNILAFDKLLRQYHGKKLAIHCGCGNKVGAAMALRSGWLRGRKMDTAMERGRSHGLTATLEQEVHNRLLVPR